MGCSSSNTPLSTPASSYVSTDDSVISIISLDETTDRNTTVSEENLTVGVASNKLFEELTKHDYNKEILERGQDNLSSSSGISRSNEDSSKYHSNLQQKHIPDVDEASNSDDEIPNVTVKDGDEDKNGTSQITDIAEARKYSLKNILIKAEQKRRQIIATGLNNDDKATIHLCHSFRDTAPVSPVGNKGQSVNENLDKWDIDEPVETAETDSNEEPSPW